MDCSSIPSLSYSEFSRRLFDSSGIRRNAIGMSLELTQRCNVRCVHCYQTWETDGHDELTTDEVCRVLDEAAEMGVLWLLLTGGEPLVRRDFWEIYEHAQRRGFVITLFTNGTLVDDEAADRLASWAPFRVEVTVHSMDRDVFESISGVEGSYERCISGVRRMADRGITLGLKSIAMRQNRDSLAEVQRWAEELGAVYRFDPHISPGLLGDDSPLDVRLSPQEVVELDLRVAERMDGWVELRGRAGPVSPKHVFTCGAGTRSMYVDACGHVAACPMTLYDTYDIRKGTLREAWEDFIPTVIYRPASPDYECGRCDLITFCGRCAGWARLEAGSEEAIVPYLCELGHLRGRAVDEHVESLSADVGASASPSSV